MHHLRQIFLKGLVAVLPIAITLYLLVWLVSAFESLFGAAIVAVLPDGAYVPGMGIAIGILLIFGVGLALQLWFARRLWNLGEMLLDRMPLVRSVFGAVKQIVSYMDSGADGEPHGKQVVIVTLGDPPLKMLGLVTRERLDFSGDATSEDELAVFLPWSYQIGGFTVFVPKAAVEPVDLSPQQALQLAMTAGVTSKKAKN